MSSNIPTPTKEISPKLRKTIDKLQTRIKSSPDYEVHQELKAVARRSAIPDSLPLQPTPFGTHFCYFNLSALRATLTGRYLRVQDYESAIQLLYIGGELLLENGLSASGADITITLIEVYNTAHMKPDSTSRGNLALVGRWLMI
jgi:hypothetical protein